jgi:NADH-quinone oxidoreductase subunit G
MALRLRQSVRQAPMRIADRLHIPEWLDHAVREAVQDVKGPLFIASPYATKLDEIATSTYRAAPDDLARLGFAVAHAIDSAAPAVTMLSQELEAMAQQIAKALLQAQRPLVVSGASCCSRGVVEAAAQVAWALCKAGRTASLSFTTPECNSLGLALLEPRPLSEALKLTKQNPEAAVIVLENDLSRRFTEAEASLLRDAQHLVVFDHLCNSMTEIAEIVLPAGTFAESDGTLVSSEGRAQRFFQALDPSTDVKASWRWVHEVSAAAGLSGTAQWRTLDELTTAMVATLPALAALPGVAPPRSAVGKIAREPTRYSGRTAMLANITVHEPKPPDDPDSALAFSMESGPAVAPPSLNPFFWAPGWNSVQSTNKFQSEIGGHLRGGDPGIRLFEPSANSAWRYFSNIPSAFTGRDGGWLLIPIFHIFGSEELSRCGQAIAQLIPQSCLAINTLDASVTGISDGEQIRIAIGDRNYEVEVTLRADMPRGVAGLPAGFPQFKSIQLPTIAKPVAVGAELSAKEAL